MVSDDLLSCVCGEWIGNRVRWLYLKRMRVLDIHKVETGENLYDSLQDTSNHRIVSLPDYMRITNSKFPPLGYGYGSGGRTPKPLRKGEKGRGIKVPLPPQVFQWGHVEPSGSRFVVKGQRQNQSFNAH